MVVVCSCPNQDVIHVFLGRKKVKSIFQNICQMQDANVKNGSCMQNYIHSRPFALRILTHVCLITSFQSESVVSRRRMLVMRWWWDPSIASCRWCPAASFSLNVWGSTPWPHWWLWWVISPPQMILDNHKIYLQLHVGFRFILFYFKQTIYKLYYRGSSNWNLNW